MILAQQKCAWMEQDRMRRNKATQLELVVKSPPASAGDLRDTGSIPGLGRSPGGGHGN